MIRAARTLASVAAIVLTSGCAQQPRLAAAWYLTPETPNTPVKIWLLNRGRAAGDVLEVHLNKSEGFPLAPTRGQFPAHLDVGGNLGAVGWRIVLCLRPPSTGSRRDPAATAAPGMPAYTPVRENAPWTASD